MHTCQIKSQGVSAELDSNITVKNRIESESCTTSVESRVRNIYCTGHWLVIKIGFTVQYDHFVVAILEYPVGCLLK